MTDQPQTRYLVHYATADGPRFSDQLHTAPWQAQSDARKFIQEGHATQIMRITIDDEGAPVAEWFNWPDNGLYRVFWKSGGSSLASIGVTDDGGRWLAPTNWAKPTIPFTQWDRIARLDRIIVSE